MECGECDNTATVCDDHAKSECRRCNDIAEYCSDHSNTICEQCGDSPAVHCKNCGKFSYCAICSDPLSADAQQFCFNCSTKKCRQATIDENGDRDFNNPCKNIPTFCSEHFSEAYESFEKKLREIRNRETKVANRELAIKKEALKLALEMMSAANVPNPFRVASERKFV